MTNKNPPKKHGRPRSFNSVEDLENKCSEYLNICLDNNRPLTFIGLACFLDICRDTIHAYLRGDHDSEVNTFSDTLKRFRARIEQDRIEGALSGKYAPSIAALDLRVNYGYVETTKLQIETGKPVDTETIKTVEDAQASYLRMIKQSHESMAT